MLFWAIYIPGFLVALVISAMVVEKIYFNSIEEWDFSDYFINGLIVLFLAIFWPIFGPIFLGGLVTMCVFRFTHVLRLWLRRRYPWMSL